jgi:Domain of Unknown Function with PDB structure (DUF3857)
MKKNILLVFALVISVFKAYSQDFLTYGVVTGEELAMKECPFDKDADAVILLNEAVSEHDDEYHFITYHHVRIKILNEKGFDAANVSLRFWRKDDFEFIDMLEAMVTNVDPSGRIIAENLTKKSFYKQNLNERIGTIGFTFPNIKSGSIIEYKYRSFMKNYNGLDDWDFQKELPVVKSKYKLTILPNTEFTYRINKKNTIPVIVDAKSEVGKVYFEMNNIPSLTDEPFMDAMEDYVQKVIFQLSGYSENGFGKTKYMTSWNEVIREMLSTREFGGQLDRKIPGTDAFMSEIKKMTGEEERMKSVNDYVRNNMSWNNIYSKYAGDGIKNPWEKKKGTSGEINLILVNLLKEADLEAYPVLVSERFHGKVNADYPFIDQFNSVFACVVIKGRKYFLDATDTYTPAHIIPNNILNTTALIVNKKNGGLITIQNDSLQYSDQINTEVTLDENGTFSAEVEIKSAGYSRIKKISYYKENGQEKFIEKYCSKEGMAINDFTFLNQTNDSMAAAIKFKVNADLSGSGQYLYLPLNLFTGFDKNPFIKDNRFSNVNFGYKRTIVTNTSIALPKNYSIDVLPKPAKMMTPDKDIQFTRNIVYDKESHSMIVVFVFDFKKSLYTADEYPVLQEVYKRMFEFLNEPVVLKKK